MITMSRWEGAARSLQADEHRALGAEANDAKGGRSATLDRRLSNAGRLFGTGAPNVMTTGVWALSSVAVVLESRRQERAQTAQRSAQEVLEVLAAHVVELPMRGGERTRSTTRAIGTAAGQGSSHVHIRVRPPRLRITCLRDVNLLVVHLAVLCFVGTI